MAGNTRGKLKEHFEGIHRNFDWCIYHVNESLKLIQEKHPHLSEGIKALGKAIQKLDDLAQSIYGRL
ncbi:hypothetical protein ES703_25439 [subsurface metagenome]